MDKINYDAQKMYLLKNICNLMLKKIYNMSNGDIDWYAMIPYKSSYFDIVMGIECPVFRLELRDNKTKQYKHAFFINNKNAKIRDVIVDFKRTLLRWVKNDIEEIKLSRKRTSIWDEIDFNNWTIANKTTENRNSRITASVTSNTKVYNTQTSYAYGNTDTTSNNYRWETVTRNVSRLFTSRRK